MTEIACDVRPMPPSLDPALLARLRQVETATVGHFRLHGFMDLRLRPIGEDLRIAGTAVTVRTVGIDPTPIALAIDGLRKGDVLVIDRSGEDRHASLGAVATAAIGRSGAVGVIVDGRVCDLPDIRRQGLPLWCTGASPLLGRRSGLGGSVNLPIACGGVTVSPGDAILADDSGILVLAPADVAAVTDEALARQAHELTILARIAAGESLSAIAGLPRFADQLSR